MVTTDRLAYSVDEAASVLGVSRRAIYSAIQSGQLPDVHLGARRLVPVDAINELLQAKGGTEATQVR